MQDRIYPLEILYDGDCAICRFDMAHLRQLNRAGRLVFVNIARPDFEPAPYGKTREQLLSEIHARRADGVMVEGAEVFRLAYEAAGLGLLVAPSRLPGMRCLTDNVYQWFSRNRGELSRRFGGIFALLTPACDEDSCSIRR